MKVLHIGDRDLNCRRFNGYDYHADLIKNNIKSSNLVMLKSSRCDYVYTVMKKDINFTKSIIKDRLFLEADIIHLHLIHNTLFDFNYLPLIAKLKPTVLTLHDTFFLGAHCIYHFDCKKWQTHCFDCPYLDKPVVIKADDTALDFEIKKIAIHNSNISAIVASEWMENKVRQSPLWNSQKIYRLPFGINQRNFKPSDKKKAKKALNIDENSMVLMFRARSTYKGLSIIKDSLRKIEHKDKITLIVLDKRGNLKELKDKFDIREIGWINDDKMIANLYQACDLFLMPSEQEAFGLMAIEAMSCGKMVLTSKGTALESVINSPACGIAVEHSTVSYTSELQRLINNVDEVEERGRKSFEFAQKYYNQDTFIKELINVYEEITADYIKNSLNTDNSELIINQLLKYNKNYHISGFFLLKKIIKEFLLRNK
jgi:glycosyltransferase involved in cell wall biosynthesis